MAGFFEGLMRWDVPEFGLRSPLFFTELSALAAVFHAPAPTVRALLPDPLLRPVEFLPGRALVVLSALQYVQSDLGPYNEFVVAFPAAFGEHRLPALDALRQGLGREGAAYAWRMPVSTARAAQAGAGIAGFPKVVADVRFVREGREQRAWVQHDGRLDVQLSVEADDSAGDRTLKLRSYTRKDGVTLQSLFVMRQTRWRDLLQPAAVRLALGDGPLAEDLRRLGLSERPIAAHGCTEAQGLLFHPRNLRDD
jgi:hypothetical protein